jgi:hypothetical protein
MVAGMHVLLLQLMFVAQAQLSCSAEVAADYPGQDTQLLRLCMSAMPRRRVDNTQVWFEIIPGESPPRMQLRQQGCSYSVVHGVEAAALVAGAAASLVAAAVVANV